MEIHTVSFVLFMNFYSLYFLGGGSSEKVVIWKLESIVYRKMICGNAYWYLS